MAKVELSKDFIGKYDDFPEHMNALGRFVYLRTYSRFLEKQGRRESWKETCKRTIEYSIGLALKHYQKIGIPIPYSELNHEAELLFDNMFNLRQFLSGRTLWIGGGENGVAEKYPLANFNCSFTNISKWEDLGELFYLLLVGTGVGFKCTKKMAAQMKPIRTNANLIHSEYKPVPVAHRLEKTEVKFIGEGYAKIYVGDSKEGWVQALNEYFSLLTEEQFSDIHTIKISYNSIREAGERLKTFGGTASGYAPLKEMFEGFDKILKNEIDTSLEPIQDGKVRPIHILDMANLIGYNVVVGGVRRTAEIALFDSDDWECILAKYGINGIWTKEALEMHDVIKEQLEALGVCPSWMHDIDSIGSGRFNLNHRRMSNNSIVFSKQPSREFLHLIFNLMRNEGEPAFVNLEELAKRRFKQLGIEHPTEEMMEQMIDDIGMNPCAEIILASKGVCNLTTVNVMQFVRDGKLDYQGLMRAQMLSARAGLRMTLVDLELENWSKTQKRDRLLGTSLTGWQDAMGALGYSKQEESGLMRDLGFIARKEADKYAKQMRVPEPLLVTTIKPEGTLSQVAGGVSSGLHASHSPYYIRRIRINAMDALAKAVMDLGWKVSAEVGTAGETEQERLANARTWVIDFPVKSDAKITKNDLTVASQFETYFKFQNLYTEHNSSNTITVKPNEWDEAEQIVWDNWNNFAAVSFLSHDGGTYALAPYEECTEEQYKALLEDMKPLSLEHLQKFENLNLDDDIGNDGCDAGVCPIR
jgi:ribonucleoside-diphosphate reductase alpha chain/ribonucleoside-triphosphate reductase